MYFLTFNLLVKPNKHYCVEDHCCLNYCHLDSFCLWLTDQETFYLIFLTPHGTFERIFTHVEAWAWWWSLRPAQVWLPLTRIGRFKASTFGFGETHLEREAFVDNRVRSERLWATIIENPFNATNNNFLLQLPLNHAANNNAWTITVNHWEYYE